ncbi:phosphotransferase family protein [Halobium salinum]|uniref:Phosphotransferase family protein n=1 Tax=Halobium salinum TaxID=1364940 RepID=A0ABD5PAB8_9EURY|nr:phosphotransferase [Halobium salinum]
MTGERRWDGRPDAQTLAVLAREFPDREAVATRPAARGNTKSTALVTFADGESVVVQVGAGDGADLRTAATLLRGVRERTSIPVPRVLAEGWLSAADPPAETAPSESRGDEPARQYVVLERVPGEDLHERFVDLDAEARRRIAAVFGRSLAELHEAFDFEGYGPVTVHDDAVGERRWRADGADGQATETEWRTWFDTYARAGARALPAPFDDLRDAVVTAVDGAELPSRPPSRLYPWDLRPGNALVAGGEVTAFLDWDGPLAADPGLAVAKVEHLVADWYVPGERDRLREAFREGYREHRDYPEVPAVYRLVAVVRSAVDGRGVVTRPLYPEVDGDDAVAFHREAMSRWL